MPGKRSESLAQRVRGRVKKKFAFGKGKGDIGKCGASENERFDLRQDGVQVPKGRVSKRGQLASTLRPVLPGIGRQGMSTRIFRVVHASIWDDEKFQASSDELQLLWFHLFTCRYNTPIGLFREGMAGLAADKGWSEKNYTETFKEGLGKPFWKVEGNLSRPLAIWFQNWWKYNKTQTQTKGVL